MNQLIQSKNFTTVIVSAVALVCIGFSPKMQAVSPPPDGCYPGFTTAEGCNALAVLTTGAGNTAVGWYSLFLDTSGNYNTGLGAGALVLNNADSNTAVGTGAMLLNTTGGGNTALGTDALLYNNSGILNNAVGAFALFNNIDGSGNSAFGASALIENIHGVLNTAMGVSALANNDLSGNGFGNDNTAVGADALSDNIDGARNTAVGSSALANNQESDLTAIGYAALFSNDVGFGNAAVGDSSLTSNSSGANNTAMGSQALTANDTGNFNTAVGRRALEDNVGGSDNTAIGWDAGRDVDGSGNICIGSGAYGVSGQSGIIQIGGQFSGHNACYIDGIYGQAWGPADMAVRIGNDGKLGTVVSSRRFKHDIKPMDKASEAILALKPVTFHYNRDANNTPCFGLIAEDVAEVSPDLVIHDKEGKPYSVRYEDVGAMLLNEFLKEHRKVQKLEAAIKAISERLKEQDGRIQKVSDQVQMSTPAAQMVVED